jgi:hypothetical protein
MSRSSGTTWAALLIAALLAGSSARARAGFSAALRRPGEAVAAAFYASVWRAYGASLDCPAASEDVRAASADRRREP